MAVLFKIFGVIGLIGIIVGVLIKNEKKQDVFFILGGVFLLAYSSYLRDWIFITLQAVFIIVAAAELIKLSSRRGLWKRLRDKIITN
ncbi:MAG: hypothetical protein WC480_04735 [Patescibacteria group bacterium]